MGSTDLTSAILQLFVTSVYFPGSPVWQHTFVSQEGQLSVTGEVCARSIG